MHIQAKILEYDHVRSGGVCKVDMLQAYLASHLQDVLSTWIHWVDFSLSVQNTEYRFQSLHSKPSESRRRVRHLVNQAVTRVLLLVPEGL